MNRKFQARLFALALAASALAYGQTAAKAAAPPPTAVKPATSAAADPVSGPTKIGVINIQAAIILTNEGQRDIGVLNTKFEPKRNELESMSKELEGLQKQLDTQGDKLNDEARATLVKQIEAKKKSGQRMQEDATSDYEAQSNEIMQRIGNKLYATLDKYAKANGFGLVVNFSDQGGPVVWASQSTNITKPVIDAYNVESGVPAPPKSATPAAPSAIKPAPPKPTSH